MKKLTEIQKEDIHILLKTFFNEKGLVRQQTNSRTSVFYINLSTLLHEQNIPIVVLKQKLELFKCFEGSEVRFSIGNDSYVISDSYSSLKMDFAVLEYMDNKFITQDEFEKKTSGCIKTVLSGEARCMIG